MPRQYPPFVVPGIGASRGQHGLDARDGALQFDEDQDDRTISTASSSSSLASLVSPEGSSKHAYPPRSLSKPRGDDGSYSDEPKGKGAGGCNGDLQHQNDDEQDDVGKELLDEEERVGLMLDARDGAPKPKWYKSGSRARPYCLVLAVAMFIFIFVQALKWLSTATTARADYEAQRSSVLSTKPQHLLEVVIPDYWRLPEVPRLKSHIHKPKHPLPKGSSKLSAFGPPFAMNFEVPPVVAPANSTTSEQKSQITMDDALDMKFAPMGSRLEWCAEDPDEGVFIDLNGNNDIVLEDVTHLRHDKEGKGEIATGGGKVVYVHGKDMKMENGTLLYPDWVKVSPDMKHVLIFTNRVAQWRHSAKTHVWLHDVKAKTSTQIGFPSDAPSISVAQWSKKGQISFVQDNNLYVMPEPATSAKVVNVTDNGAEQFFNGIPDWVYEEEVFESSVAHWWSPEGNRLVYLAFNETNVQEYTLPVYNPTQESEHALLYPKQKKLKYPKPGTANPDVDIFVWDVATSKTYELSAPASSTIKTPKELETQTADAAMRAAGSDILITEVKWLSDSTLLVRETNRWSDAMRWLSFDCRKPSDVVITGTIGRRESTSQSGGWIPANQDVRRVGTTDSSTAYIDLVALPHGYRHIAYYASAKEQQPTFLTAGEWEVESILFVGNGKIYFSAAYPRPSLRHILYVSIPDRSSTQAIQPVYKPKSLTDIKEDAWYEASFDPKGAYYELQYGGPGIPWTKVLSLRDKTLDLMLNDNEDLAKTVSRYVQPQQVFYNITTPDGVIVSVQEIRPHDFDGTGATRYPALLKVYGGPDSQMVSAKWDVADWSSYLACTLGYIVIVVDGRGTGYRGRDYRDVVTWRLGDAEATDVIAAAEAIRRLPYIAQSKIGIWGWSYGGYLTAKVIERDSGTFDLGMSVAPVTRWEFYDSIYTERYMKTPHLNKFGYQKAGVHVTKGFENSHFLLAQGSADDNVHYQNSAHLLDMLTQNQIRGYWFRMFTDSRHSMQMRGAYHELHQFMTRFLVYNWGAGGQRTFRYGGDKSEVQGRSFNETGAGVRLRSPVALDSSAVL